LHKILRFTQKIFISFLPIPSLLGNYSQNIASHEVKNGVIPTVLGVKDTLRDGVKRQCWLNGKKRNIKHFLNKFPHSVWNDVCILWLFRWRFKKGLGVPPPRNTGGEQWGCEWPGPFGHHDHWMLAAEAEVWVALDPANTLYEVALSPTAPGPAPSQT